MHFFKVARFDFQYNSNKALEWLTYVWNVLLQSSVCLDNVFKFLMDFRADESLCRDTQTWNQVGCSRNLSQ